jgi:hypothetical protein
LYVEKICVCVDDDEEVSWGIRGFLSKENQIVHWYITALQSAFFNLLS